MAGLQVSVRVGHYTQIVAPKADGNNPRTTLTVSLNQIDDAQKALDSLLETGKEWIQFAGDWLGAHREIRDKRTGISRLEIYRFKDDKRIVISLLGKKETSAAYRTAASNLLGNLD
jgi:hypothetical protein